MHLSMVACSLGWRGGRVAVALTVSSRESRAVRIDGIADIVRFGLCPDVKTFWFLFRSGVLVLCTHVVRHMRV